MSPRVAVRQPQKLVGVLVSQLSPVYDMQLRSEDVVFLLQCLGCGLNTPIWVALSISLLHFVLSFGSSNPVRQSNRCICSELTFLCGVVSFTTGLTGWVHRYRSSVFLIICVVCVGIIVNFIVGVRFCLISIIVVIFGPIRVISSLVVFSFELTALVPIVTWLSAMVASWFGLFGVLLCCLLRHSVYFHFIRGFQRFSSNSFSRCDAICSYVPFSNCAWLIDFFRWRDIFAYNNCSMIAWAATPNASFDSFSSSFRKSIILCFAGLKTSCWNLCFAAAIDWGFTYFLRNTVGISPKFSLLGLVMFLKVCSASPRMRKWK